MLYSELLNPTLMLFCICIDFNLEIKFKLYSSELASLKEETCILYYFLIIEYV